MPDQPHRELVDLHRLEADLSVVASASISPVSSHSPSENFMMFALWPRVTRRRRCRFAYSNAYFDDLPSWP